MKKILPLIIILIAIDQLSKFIIRHSGGFYICNKNLAFGISFSNWMIVLITLLVLILFLNLKHQKPSIKQITSNKSRNNYSLKFEICDLFGFWNLLFVILIISGAISNLIDRFASGCVMDFIDLRFWPVFNLADVFICLGAIMILIKQIRFQK